MITLVTQLADGMSHLTLQVMYVYLPVTLIVIFFLPISGLPCTGQLEKAM